MCPITHLEVICPACQKNHSSPTYNPYPEEAHRQSKTVWVDRIQSIDIYSLEKPGKHQTGSNAAVTRCPHCSHYFRLVDSPALPENFESNAASEFINSPQWAEFIDSPQWEELYRVLEIQRFSKIAELNIRLSLWECSNNRRRKSTSLSQDFWRSCQGLLSIIKLLFTITHLKIAGIFSLGALVPLIVKQDPYGAAVVAGILAAVPTMALLFFTAILIPVIISCNSDLHRQSKRAKRDWLNPKGPYQKNLATLLPFLDGRNPRERLIKAEAHRQLGQFDIALAQFEEPFPEGYEMGAQCIKELCIQRDSSLAEISNHEWFDLDSVNESSRGENGRFEVSSNETQWSS
jgi:hypothetical protein